MKRISAVLLDAGGVFLLPHEPTVRAVLQDVSVAVETAQLQRAHYAAMRALDAAPGTNVYLPAYVRALGVPAAEADRVAEGLEGTPWLTVVPESIEGLARIVATGVTVAIVSNSDGSIERQLAELGVCQAGPGPGPDVAAVIDSTVVGATKPDPRIFEIALSRVGSPPQEALHVGDSVHTDVEGARAAGVRPFHFDPYRLCRAPDHEHLERLYGLLGLLDNR